MTYTVTVTGTDISFPCEPDESVLDAAERSGYAIPYSCRKGVCSSCEGALDAGRLDVRGWGMSQGPQSGVLFCQARPSTDTSITPKRITKQDKVIRKTLTAKVHRITRPAPDVTVVQLRLPTGVRAKFAAGQYLKVFLDDGDSRSYSMANPPHENDGVQLHIRRVQGGRFSDEVLGGLEKGTRLRVELPYGEFSLNPDSDRPVIFVASGTGFAPVKSIIEDHLKRGGERSVHLYWGARGQGDILPTRVAREVGLGSGSCLIHSRPVTSRGGLDRTHRARSSSGARGLREPQRPRGLCMRKPSNDLGGTRGFCPRGRFGAREFLLRRLRTVGRARCHRVIRYHDHIIRATGHQIM